MVLFAAPAGAQQLVDAGKEGDGSGGLAFVLFAVMVMICGGAMFFMDHVAPQPPPTKTKTAQQ